MNVIIRIMENVKENICHIICMYFFNVCLIFMCDVALLVRLTSISKMSIDFASFFYAYIHQTIRSTKREYRRSMKLARKYGTKQTSKFCNVHHPPIYM
jgi:hypothetical protein